MCTTPRSVLHYKIKSFAALIQWKSFHRKPRKIISVVGRQTLVRQSSFGHGNAWEKPIWASQWPESRRKSGSAGPTPGTPGGAAAETGASSRGRAAPGWGEPRGRCAAPSAPLRLRLLQPLEAVRLPRALPREKQQGAAELYRAPKGVRLSGLRCWEQITCLTVFCFLFLP